METKEIETRVKTYEVESVLPCVCGSESWLRKQTERGFIFVCKGCNIIKAKLPIFRGMGEVS